MDKKNLHEEVLSNIKFDQLSIHAIFQHIDDFVIA